MLSHFSRKKLHKYHNQMEQANPPADGEFDGEDMESWSYKDVHIILTDEEASYFLELVEPDPTKQFSYHIISTYRRNTHREIIDKRISHLLHERLKKDPYKFKEDYEQRRFLKDKAIRYSAFFIRKFGLITGIVTFKERDMTYYITSNYKTGIFGIKRHKQTIAIPVESIQRLEGTVTNFEIETDKLILTFDLKEITIEIK